jgi:hypothetical protein
MIALMMEASRTSETSVNFYQTTRHNIPEDSHLHTRRHADLKSQTLKFGTIKQDDFIDQLLGSQHWSMVRTAKKL